MVVGDSHRAGIEIQPVFKGRGLLRRPILFADRAPSHGEHAAAGTRAALEHTTVITDLAELVGDGQSGEAGTEDKYASPGGSTGQIEGHL